MEKIIKTPRENFKGVKTQELAERLRILEGKYTELQTKITQLDEQIENKKVELKTLKSKEEEISVKNLDNEPEIPQPEEENNNTTAETKIIASNPVIEGRKETQDTLEGKQPELKMVASPLTNTQIEENNTAINNLLNESEKNNVAMHADEDTYNEASQMHLLGAMTEQEEKEARYSWKDRAIDTAKDAKETWGTFVKSFRRRWWKYALMGGLWVGASGFTTNADGELRFDYTGKRAFRPDIVISDAGKVSKAFGRYWEGLFGDEGTVTKIMLYLGNAPTDPDKLQTYIERVQDTKNRGEGKGVVQASIVNPADNPVTFETEPDEKPELEGPPEPETDSLDNQESTIERPDSTLIKINEKLDKTITKLGGNKEKFKPTKTKNLWVGELYNDKVDGLHGRSVIDMSKGMKVIYQPRNESDVKRSDAQGVALISDYLYDFDFTDNVEHEHAKRSLEMLKQKIEKKDFTNCPKFVQVREKVPGSSNVYIVKVKPVTELTAKDFDEHKVYRQSWAKLSELDISADQKKIKLTNYSKKFNAHLFKGQGLPFHSGQGDHNLRLPGGVGNHGEYQNISSLDLFGAYIGGTVIIVSDDGKIVKKVTGSVKDVVTIALEIKKLTGGKEVHFLQSDAGSMNVKAIAKKGTILKSELDITRNQESWAGASEIMLEKQD